ncbi:hypothetical protein BDB01DRAFT_236076 [Pilobolus umbonatus]|nr:hypothetical protein BDB01DRAFT_236076 [Pilobolus umbonatus]
MKNTLLPYTMKCQCLFPLFQAHLLSSFYQTKSLQYMMEIPSCLCKCITMSKNDVDVSSHHVVNIIGSLIVLLQDIVY